MRKRKQTTIIDRRPIIGSFSKAIDGGVSLNFDLSGGVNCDKGCAYHPDNNSKESEDRTPCYAARSEIRPDRAQLAAKLLRHSQMSPTLVVHRALAEIRSRVDRGVFIPWLRVSTNGSVPMPRKVRKNKAFRAAFRALLSFCQNVPSALQDSIPVHIPVESWAKARFYRAWLGDLATIRESVQRTVRFATARGAVSIVAGNQSHSRVERVELARQLAEQRRTATGRKTIVCPAILNSFASRKNKAMYNPRAKCGLTGCTACENPLVDIVYPLH